METVINLALQLGGIFWDIGNFLMQPGVWEFSLGVLVGAMAGYSYGKWAYGRRTR